MKFINDIAVFGTHDDNTIKQIQDVSKNAVKTALLSDGHKGYGMPVGGVAAYRNKILLNGVGSDIACGNVAIKTNLKLADISRKKLVIADITNTPELIRSDEYLLSLANEIQDKISFGIGQKHKTIDVPLDDKFFMDARWNIIPEELRKDLHLKAETQIGTVGSGNHYVDVFVDENETIWVGVHHGSRGFGYNIAEYFFKQAQNVERPNHDLETIIDLNTQLGKDYWDLMELCGDYAYLGRNWVARKAMSFMNGVETDYVHNHHNFAWKESHFGEELIVVRKGATPASPGQRGFVGGSCGDNAVILEGSTTRNLSFGIDNEAYDQQMLSMYSTVHGAGRVMSRTEARGKFDRKKKKYKTTGKISRDMMSDWLKEKGVIMRGGDTDESPHVYRRLSEVLKSQENTINVLHTLRPIISVMAGHDNYDPYKE